MGQVTKVTSEMRRTSVPLAYPPKPRVRVQHELVEVNAALRLDLDVGIGEVHEH